MDANEVFQSPGRFPKDECSDIPRCEENEENLVPVLV